ncbi:MAG: LysR family transcriptional regulator substrate-binding protein, partial [Clostridia bacterium]|nr:LysR family transcriptional regulator substrate-binding protein [Clostridia bacterium]
KKESFGLIKIGVNTSNLNQLFFDALTELLKYYPSTEVSITRYTEAQLYEKLESGKLDYIAVDSEFSKDNLQPVAEFNIEYQIIGNEGFYNKYKSQPLTIKNFAQENLILANKFYTSRLNIDEFFRKNYISLSPKLELDGYSYIKNFVEMGYGISVVNPYYFQDAITEKSIYIINKNFDFPKRKIIFAKDKNNKLGKILLVFENIINNLCKIN